MVNEYFFRALILYCARIFYYDKCFVSKGDAMQELADDLLIEDIAIKEDEALADMVIFGGGVLGLWLLNRLRAQGFSAFLFESQALGGGQTVKSQGILHGGMKYALKGHLTDEAKALADMPAYWDACLKGEGEIDLSQVTVLSQQHYLWSPNPFAAKLGGFLAGMTLASKVQALPAEAYPAPFQHPAFKGDVYALNEKVIDVPSLLRELIKANQDAIFHIEPLSADSIHLDDLGNIAFATVYQNGKAINIKAQQFIFAAGVGNELILNKIKGLNLAMQRRPLHMVFAKFNFPAPLYAHCLGLSAKPRITVTTHPAHDGKTVWYLGGGLAEEGVQRDSAIQINVAKKELQSLFPWFDFSTAEWGSFMVDRAEPKEKSGEKPNSYFYHVEKNFFVAWPTKLVLAPALAAEIVAKIQHAALTPRFFDAQALRAFPLPPVAVTPWDEVG